MALYTKAELAKRTLAELKGLANQNDIELEKGWKKPDLIEALLEIEEPELEEELEDELEDEEDDELDEEVLEEEPLDEEDDIEPEPAPKKSKAKKQAKDGDTLAAKQVATLLGTEAKTLRQFFRSPASTVEAVGSGGRYEFLESDIEQIKSEFDSWKAQHASRGAKRGQGKSSKPAEEVEEVEEIEELDLEEDFGDEELDDEELELEDED